MIASIDWRSLLAVCGILCALALLIAYQNRASTERSGRWLNHSALSLELLGLALSVFWAVKAPEGAILPIIFCAGFIGMLIGRAILIPQLVKNWGTQPKASALGIFALTVAYIALYGSGLFNAVNDSGNEAQTRLEASVPALSLDSEIKQAKERITRLATFSNAEKAHAETQEIAIFNQKAKADYQALKAELAQYQNKLVNCPANYKTNCINPAKAEIARINALLGQVPMDKTTSYAKKYDEYEGLQTHLTSLQKQRANLSENGTGVQSMWQPEDKMIAWLFGITEEKANRVKWLIFTFIFDLLSLLFRIMSAIILPRDEQAKKKQRFNALIGGGLSVDEAMAIMSNQTPLKPAVVNIPHLDTGGRIDADGTAMLHANEIVLNALGTKWFDDNYKGLLDATNAGDFIQAQRIIDENTGATHQKDTGATPRRDPSPSILYKNMGRVPLKLSQMKGKGRTGKVDCCIDCGDDFIVKAYNSTRCEPCAIKAEKLHHRKK